MPMADRRHAPFALLLVLLLVAPAAAQNTTEGDRPCDFNKDDRVDDVERRQCAAQACDTDKDGAVSAAEKEACQERVEDKCDFNKDGRVGDVERRQCAEGATTSTSGDKPPCAPPGNNDTKLPPCPPPGDKPPCAPPGGNDTELPPCPPPGGQAPQGGQPGAPDEACRAAMQAWNEERRAFEEEQRQKWEQFGRDREERLRTWRAENHTEAEMEAHRAEAAEERRAFEEEMHVAKDAWIHDHPAPEACQRAGPGAAPACGPATQDHERFRAYADEKARAWREAQDARLRLFDERQAAEKEAFAAENHTAEEQTAFEERQLDERARFMAGMEEAALRHAQDVEREWSKLQDNNARSCARPEDAPRKVADIQRDNAGARVACGLEAHEAVRAFFDEHGDDPRNWTEEERAQMDDLRRGVEEGLRACEGDLHAEWKEEVRRHNEEIRPEERFGRFNITSDEDGEGSGAATGRYVSFAWDKEPASLRDYTVQGLLVVEEVSAPGAAARARGEGARLEIAAEDCRDEACSFRARVHDNPTGALEGLCREAAGCYLRFPAHANVSEQEAGEEQARYLVDLGGEEVFLHVHGEHAWSGSELSVNGAWRLFLPAENFVFAEAANKHRDSIKEAVGEGKVLAEVNVVLAGDELATEAVSYEAAGPEGEGVSVEVERKPEGGLSLEFGAESATGRTLVFNLDPALFGGDAVAALNVEDFLIDYYEVEGDAEEKVEIRRAESVLDVLEPDEDAPEWWLVLDANGLQLMVSNPHFSEKRVEVTTMSSDASAEGGDAGAQTPGPGVALVLAAVGAAFLAARRRRG